MKKEGFTTLTGSICLLLILAALIFTAACASSPEIPLSTHAPTTAPAPTQTLAPAAKPNSEPVPTATPTPPLTPTPTTEPSPTPTPTPTPEPTPTPTPTPTPPPTPEPEPTPTPTPVQRVTVEIGKTSIRAGQSAEIAIVVKGITAAGGLGAYHIGIDFDQRGIRVDKVLGGDAPFNTPIANIAEGYVEITQFHAQLPGPRGDTIIVRLSVTALSQGNWPLSVTSSPRLFVDTNGDEMVADVINGSFIVTP